MDIFKNKASFELGIAIRAAELRPSTLISSESFELEDKAYEVITCLVSKGVLLDNSLCLPDGVDIEGISPDGRIQLRNLQDSLTGNQWKSLKKESLNLAKLKPERPVKVDPSELSDQESNTLASIMHYRKARDVFSTLKRLEGLISENKIDISSVLNLKSLAPDVQEDLNLLGRLLLQDLRPLSLSEDLTSGGPKGQLSKWNTGLQLESNKSIFARGSNQLWTACVLLEKLSSELPCSLKILTFSIGYDSRHIAASYLFGLWSHTLQSRSIDYLSVTTSKSPEKEEILKLFGIRGAIQLGRELAYALLDVIYAVSLDYLGKSDDDYATSRIESPASVDKCLQLLDQLELLEKDKVLAILEKFRPGLERTLNKEILVDQKGLSIDMGGIIYSESFE